MLIERKIHKDIVQDNEQSRILRPRIRVMEWNGIRRECINASDLFELSHLALIPNTKTVSEITSHFREDAFGAVFTANTYIKDPISGRVTIMQLVFDGHPVPLQPVALKVS